MKGLDRLDKQSLNKPGGILFLANHPAEIDPCILLKVFWPRFRLHPIAIEYLFHKPIISYLLNYVGALPFPNFDNATNSYKIKRMEKTYESIFDLLNRGENILIYPAGGLKNGPEEVIGGASGVKTVLDNVPDANVVLIKTTGLWGSSFSRAPTGKTPDLFEVFLNGLKVLLKNFIFFAPRREVTIECEPAPNDFPWNAERRELNRYLEEWYNGRGVEPLNLVSFSHWREVYPKIQEREKPEEVRLENVSEEVKGQVIEEISKLTKTQEIKPEHHLSMDLALDSLDFSQLVFVLKENFGVDVRATDLTTVASVMAYAAHVKKGREEETEEVKVQQWKDQGKRPDIIYPEGDTLPEVLLKSFERMKGYQACADLISGEVSYKKLKYAVLLLAEEIRKIPDERIGILLPASVAVNAVIMATMIANKTPVMINWTLGKRNLFHVVEQSGIKTTLSSWSFIDRLDNVDLDGLDDQIVLLEDFRKKISLRSHMKALRRTFKQPSSLLKIFELNEQRAEDTAVILFTSGTESVPKGVPLSHKNLMENQRSVFSAVKIDAEDILLGTLPSFHSFGFAVTGILPFISGIRVAYSPNPTDGRRIVSAIKRWNVTLFCIAPSFLKNMLRVAKKDQLSSLRLIICGAEKTAQEIYDKVDEMQLNAKIIEGYGITECGPILTINPLDERPKKGVGLPLPNVELKIVNPESYSSVQNKEKGLILAKGPNIFSGYLNPRLPSPFLEEEGKKWYRTGDLGYLDEDGYLILSGRLKRFVKIGGEMVGLTAIEEILLEAAEAKNWEIEEDKPPIAVVAKEEEGKKSEIYLFTILSLSAEEVNQILKESGMSNLIRIRTVIKVPFIPQLGTGKVDYKKLQDRLNP